MAELPEDFLNWKSFKSLTTTACVAWAIILVIDVVFISNIDDKLSQLKWLWGIGFFICFVLASLRLYFKENREKGDKLFLVFNAALIFLYASGFNGFTKELGSWSEVKNNIASLEGSTTGTNKLGVGNFLAAWVPNIFANQTSFWPDGKLITERNDLKRRNNRLQDSLQEMAVANQDSILNLSNKVKTLHEENNKLRQQIIKSAGDNSTIQNLLNDNAAVKDDAQKKYEIINDLSGQIKILQSRITAFNVRQSRWNSVNPNYVGDVRGMVTKATNDRSFYDFIFRTPIDTAVHKGK